MGKQPGRLREDPAGCLVPLAGLDILGSEGPSQGGCALWQIGMDGVRTGARGGRTSPEKA